MYKSSFPLPPKSTLEEVMYPLLSLPLSKIIPKSCSGEFIGYFKFSALPQVLSPVLSALNTSKPPKPM